jgi:hypothetical protein
MLDLPLGTVRSRLFRARIEMREQLKDMLQSGRVEMRAPRVRARPAAMDRATVDRATVDRNTVDRNTVDRNTVDRSTVDRSTVDRVAAREGGPQAAPKQ